eukprot:scaffold8966_cov73-Cylindrotheca_fusiformis.AAC.3
MMTFDTGYRLHGGIPDHSKPSWRIHNQEQANSNGEPMNCFKREPLLPKTKIVIVLASCASWRLKPWKQASKAEDGLIRERNAGNLEKNL